MEPILHENYPLSKRRISRLQWQAQLTPSPQGFSSLPRVSEAFTPNTTINQQQQLKKIKPNANRFNMLTDNTNNNNIYQIQPHRLLWAHSYTSIFNFHKMRENMAWSTNLLSSWWICKNGDEDLPSMASQLLSNPKVCLQLESGWTTTKLAEAP